MGFLGINPCLQEKFNSWRLPGSIVDAFVAGLKVLDHISPKRLPCDEHGIFLTVDVDDEVDPRGGYIFRVRMARNDSDFWAADIVCFEVNGGGDVIWSSDGTMP